MLPTDPTHIAIAPRGCARLATDLPIIPVLSAEPTHIAVVPRGCTRLAAGRRVGVTYVGRVTHYVTAVLLVVRVQPTSVVTVDTRVRGARSVDVIDAVAAVTPLQ